MAKSIVERWMKLLTKAEEATTRKKAKKCIRKAEKLGEELSCTDISTNPTDET